MMMASTTIRPVAYVLGVLVLLAIWLAHGQTNGFGFPDGHLTDLERAYVRLSDAVLVPAIVLGINFLVLGRMAKGTRWFWISVLVLVLCIVGLYVTCAELSGRLEDGTGG